MHKIIPYHQATETLSPTEKVGQFFMPAAFINDTEAEVQRLEKLILEQGVGGLCFFHSRTSAATNFEGEKKILRNESSFETLKELIQRYQAVSKYSLLIAIDAEWGLAMRIENTPQYPYAITLGALQENNKLIFEVGKNIARDCRAAGIHWNLSPVVDINNNPKNPVIGYRSFGEHRDAVTKKAIAYIKGAESEGILTSIKHFPGHGDTATDSHLGLPLIDKSKSELVANELYPFQKIIDDGVDSVMVGHLSVPSLANGKKVPSSISKDIIKGLLRNEMGFKGVVISDALNMHAISKNYPVPGDLEWLAFDAGNDILCFAEQVKSGIENIISNASKKQIEESFERIWKLKEKAITPQIPELNTGELNKQAALNLSFDDASILNKKIAEKSITLYKGTDEDIANFRTKDYCTLTFKRSDINQPDSEILKSLETIKSEIKDEEDILLLLTPPKVKPSNNFDFLQQEIDLINEIIHTKNVVLYHYGNPYVLQLFKIKNTLATVLVYQEFKEFQEVATMHFLGKLKAEGKLSVTIN